jgi:hypothetical protein
MDACYSGPLLALNHYRCHFFLRQRCQCRLCTTSILPLFVHIYFFRNRQALSVRSESRKKALRRHTEAPGHLLLAYSTAFLRRRFSSVVTTTLAIIRLKSRVAKRSKSKKCEKEKEKESRLPTPNPILVHCSRCNRDHDLSDAPDVVWACFPCLSSLLLSHLV